MMIRLYGISNPLRYVSSKLFSTNVIISNSNNNKSVKKSNISRMPYRLYKSIDGINIRVGRTAKDNDLLSSDVKYKVDDYWWLHVAGSSGSHVVICSNDPNLPMKYKETLNDAAFLALLHSSLCSKTKNVNIKADIHYTKCKNVYKNKNDPDGLVYLGNGPIYNIIMNGKNHKEREKRLQESIYPLNYNDLIEPI